MHQIVPALFVTWHCFFKIQSNSKLEFKPVCLVSIQYKVNMLNMNMIKAFIILSHLRGSD